MNKDHHTYRRPDGRVLRIIEGDLTEQDSDAIVNAANEMLAHGGGGAGALSRKGGPPITRGSRRRGEQHRRGATGNAPPTRGGDPKTRHGIHAGGPGWGGGWLERGQGAGERAAR